MAWNSASHPRASKGAAGGGQFISASSSTSGNNTSAKAAAGVQRKVGLDAQKIRAFQRMHKLQVDGVVGHQTAEAILGNKNASPAGHRSAHDQAEASARHARTHQTKE